jgi:hypothetical protein
VKSARYGKGPIEPAHSSLIPAKAGIQQFDLIASGSRSIGCQYPFDLAINGRRGHIPVKVNRHCDRERSEREAIQHQESEL